MICWPGRLIKNLGGHSLPGEMPRCCEGVPGEFEPCYASVLVAGLGLKSAVEDLEESQLICPCVTAWCGVCKRVSLTVNDRGLFPCPSAQLAHALAFKAHVEETLLLADGASSASI